MNRIPTFLTISFIVCLVNGTAAQWHDNTSTFKQPVVEKYLRFHYDNDFFTRTDYYYSQGITIEYVNPGLRKNPLNKILIKASNALNVYGLTFNLFGYTPTSIKSNVVLVGDRPFDANITLKSFVMGSDSVRSHRLASSVSVGIMGPAALGAEIQTNIHRWTGNKIPVGWRYQVSNDIIVNYQLNYEKKLFAAGDVVLINAAAEGRIGTLHTRASGGINAMLGKFNNPYSSVKKYRTQFYLYMQGRGNVIGYDATMQGGLFNRTNAYIIPRKDIERTTFQADAGVLLTTGRFFLSYSQSYLTKEFQTGRYHRWGGFNVGFGL